MPLIAKDHRLVAVNARLDIALERRVELHQARAAGTIDVATYSRGLREVRNVEDECEAIRKRAGLAIGRAVELCAADGHKTATRLVLQAEGCRNAQPPDPEQALLESLNDRRRSELLDTSRKPDWTNSSGSSGPLRASVDWHGGKVDVQAYSDAEWAAEAAYHVYWRVHAYDTLNEDLRAAAPPSPPIPKRKVTFTLAQVRKLVREAQSGQLAIDSDQQLSSRKSDWRCEKCGGTNDVAGWPRACVDCNPPQILKPGKPARPARPAPTLYSGAPPRGWKGKVRALVAKRPGITIPEIAAEVHIAHNHLYRWLPESELVKRGRGWYPKDRAKAKPEPDSRVENWTTEAKIEAMRAEGWTETHRETTQGRIVVHLNHAADKVDTFRSLPAPEAPQQPVAAPLPPLAAQLDLDGNAHEIAPQTRQDQLFQPAPVQLDGQLKL